MTQIRDTPGTFRAWLKTARPGEVCIYHKGLPIPEARAESPDIDVIADLALLAYEVRAAHLAQRRGPNGATIYLAIRSSDGSMPRSVLTGACSPVQYRILREIHQLDADMRMSAARIVARILRTDRVDITSAALDDVVRRGWVAKGEPRQSPYRLTSAGIAALMQ